MQKLTNDKKDYPQKEYKLRYYYKNRDMLLAKHKIWYEKNYKKQIQKMKKYREKLRKQIEQTLGSVCAICSERTKKMCYHEKNFREHRQQLSYILEHIEDFIVLCSQCHNTIHRVKRYQKQFEELIK